jgi:molybdenum-dependent DNA-binding transcriptional regulator ModE
MGQALNIGSTKIGLLEHIEQCRSLSQAVRMGAALW